MIISIPLLDFNGIFDIHRIHNVPLSGPLNITSDAPTSDMVTKYQLEADTFAVNSEHTHYALLNSEDTTLFTNSYVKYCSIRSPTYPTNVSKLCLIAMFTDSMEKK